MNPARPVSLADGDVRASEAWSHAPWTDDFVDIEGDRKERPEWQTRVKMLWDDEALYLGAWMEVRECFCRELPSFCVPSSTLPSPAHRVLVQLPMTRTTRGPLVQEPCVVATLRERNSVVFHDNDFEVFLDAEACNHNYYELEVNALNTIWELRLDKPYKNGGSEHSERVGMKGQGNLPNLRTAIKGLVLS